MLIWETTEQQAYGIKVLLGDTPVRPIFLRKFERISRGWLIQFNLMALLLGPYWFLKKHMTVSAYLFAILSYYLSFEFISVFFKGEWGSIQSYWYFCFIIPHLLAGFLGNFWYFLWARHQVNNVLKIPNGHVQMATRLQWRGRQLDGVQMIGASFVMTLFLIFYLLVLFVGVKVYGDIFRYVHAFLAG